MKSPDFSPGVIFRIGWMRGKNLYRRLKDFRAQNLGNSGSDGIAVLTIRFILFYFFHLFHSLRVCLEDRGQDHSKQEPMPGRIAAKKTLVLQKGLIISSSLPSLATVSVAEGIQSGVFRYALPPEPTRNLAFQPRATFSQPWSARKTLR